jgi:hypothetical protein
MLKLSDGIIQQNKQTIDYLYNIFLRVLIPA